MAFVGNETATVWNTTQGAIDPATGLPTSDSYTRHDDVNMTVTPLTGEDVETLPAGEDAQDWRKAITEFELQIPDDDTGDGGSIVEYRNVKYRVRSVRDYNRVIPHVEARLRRLSGPHQDISLP
jgi:hypothetical protein